MRSMKQFNSILLTGLFSVSLAQNNMKVETMAKEIYKTEAEWQTCLTPQEYEVLRQKGTEIAFTGKYYKHDEEGTYTCAACGLELFQSQKKYDSGSGWPSFWGAIDKARIIEKKDNTLGIARIEITCGGCGSHLGHLFPDGPQPSGDRYCVNSISLDFKNNKDAENSRE